MKKQAMEPSVQDRESLYKRYLFWLYKTIREDADRIDRKFTQLVLDERIAAFLERDAASLDKDLRCGVGPFVEEWKTYIAQKADDARKLKFSEAGSLKFEYVFLRLKLKAVERLIVERLGRRHLKEFRRRLEEAAMQGILQDHSGRR
ncbi:MAG: hypothetical protein ACE14U_07625 [Candidatus Velamenicoccus archaeovorus]